MSKNKRSVERETPTANLPGKFSLHAGSNVFDVRLVRDASPFGIGLKITEQIDKNTRIRLCYKYNDISYEAHGMVIWSSLDKDMSSTADETLYRVGIQFNPEETSTNVDFYNMLMGQQPD